ncbi:MAG: type II toxin-antitoxin system death-on-curing family toxin [Polyangiaceae bacterium]|nr:type II toxin-antitoxin system death-on-curing family toxin [Polyangiaceae bacterium]MCL4755716.1 type II toxin-antitoxin system death-on-curing family toxin [Myxococcales bacterium]
MRHLSLTEVIWLHDRLIQTSGGTSGIRDLGQVEAAVAQPRATFDGADVYPDLIAKAATLCFGLVRGHGFVDGNKRVGHAAMELFLALNGVSLDADVDDHEQIILTVADGTASRDQLEAWVRAHTRHDPAAPA